MLAPAALSPRATRTFAEAGLGHSVSDTALAAVTSLIYAISSAVLAQVRIERGDVPGARVALDSLGGDPAVLEVVPNQIVREARARLLMAEGQPREALTQLHDYALWEQQSGLESSGGPMAWRPAAALAHLQLGEVDEARELAVREVDPARAFAAGPRLGAALRALAIVEGGTDGLALLEEAVSVLAASGARLDHAHALVDLGVLLRRCGRRTAATDTLRAGRELAHPLRLHGAGRVRRDAAAPGRRSSQADRAQRPRFADAGRAPSDGPGGAGHEQQADSPGAVRDPENGGDAPLQRLSQARDLLT